MLSDVWARGNRNKEKSDQFGPVYKKKKQNHAGQVLKRLSQINLFRNIKEKKATTWLRNMENVVTPSIVTLTQLFTNEWEQRCALRQHLRLRPLCAPTCINQ